MNSMKEKSKRKFFGDVDGFSIKRVNLLTKPAISTILALLLTLFVTDDLTSDALLDTVVGSSDIEVSDFYNRIRSGGSSKPLDDEIIIVNIDSVFSREELTLLIEEISSQSPEIIGLDVIFEEPKDSLSDREMLKTLTGIPNIVAAQRFDDSFDSPSDDFLSINIPGLRRGMANLTSNSERGIVREVTFFFGTESKYPGLSAAMTKYLSEDKYENLKKRTEDEMIRFQPTEFYVIYPDEIYENPSIVKDKIVFIGTIKEESDLHPTPLSNNYPGVMIHANVVKMILKDDFVNRSGDTLNFILGLISCLGLSFLYVYLDELQNFLLRILPILWIGGLLLLGCWLFNLNGIYINAPETMVWAALSLLVLDIWTAIEKPATNLFNKLKRKLI